MSIRAIVLLLVVVWCATMHQAIAADKRAETIPSVCQLPLEKGMCKARMQRYGYDQTYQNCVQFIYGGCKGNANNFKTKQECEKACGASNK